MLALTLGISTAIAGGATDRAAAAADLTAFGDCDAFTAHMRELAGPEVGPYGFGGGPILYKGGPMPEAAPATDARAGNSPTGAVGNGESGTNVQERGVDEADLVKIDGDRVLAVAGGRLTITDASEDKPELKGSLAFPEGQYSSELLVLDDQRALVVGTAYEAVDRKASPPTDTADAPAGAAPEAKDAVRFAPTPGATVTPVVVLTLVDTSRSARPTVLRTEMVTGRYISARLNDGVARLVLTSQPRIAFSHPRQGESETASTARNKAAVRDAKATDWLPEREVRDASGRVVADGPLMGCTDVFRPSTGSGLGIISVLTLDTDRGGQMHRAEGDATGVVSNGELVYSSPQRLYVATTDGGWNRPVDSRQTGAADQRTQIHAFDVTSRSASSYVGSGSVPGYLYDRWAMSEHEGHLRVATTTGPPWTSDEGPVSESSVLVLDEVADGLKVVGSVGKLGLTERVRAVRWFDDLAAVVTFRQTDPLYLIDLSDPTAPKKRGELKIPGYSAYLHPLGGEQLLGVGQDADAEGRVTELQVSAFDISELTRPTRTDALGFGRGYTQVEHDARAFTYLPDRRLAVLPASVTEKVYCPPNAQCTAAGGRPVDDAAGEGFVGEIQVPAVLGVAVGRDGNLHQQGRFVSDSEVIRVLPVGDRLAAVTYDSVILLDPAKLTKLGSTRIVPEEPKPQPDVVEPARPVG